MNHAPHTPDTSQDEEIFSPLSAQDFDFSIKKRKPLWQRMIFSVALFGVIWGGSHVGLNYSAYSQIVSFKFNELMASVTEEFQPEPEALEMKKTVVLAQEEAKQEPTTYSDTLSSYAANLFGDMEAYPSDDRIEIPRINKSVPLISVPDNQDWNALERGIQNGLRNGVVVHPVSRDPSSNGNFFVTGHSSYYPWDTQGRFNDVFALLHEVELGDDVIVYWKGKKYEYVIEESKVVLPTEVSVLEQPTDEKVLSLMTCTPVGTAEKRLIKTAVPKY